MPRLLKLCQHCQKVICGRRRQARYCSVRCRLDAQVERRRQLYNVGFDPQTKKDVGINPATGHLDYLPRSCDNCGRPLPRRARSDKRFCSDKCRKSDWLWRRRWG
jgi:hypothetical protein